MTPEEKLSYTLKLKHPKIYRDLGRIALRTKHADKLRRQPDPKIQDLLLADLKTRLRQP